MAQSDWFDCPQCAARYTWQPHQAGRKVRCRCAAVIRIPAAPGSPALLIEAPLEPVRRGEGDLPSSSGFSFELDATESNTRAGHRAVSGMTRCEHCGQPVRPGAVLCVACGKPIAGRSAQDGAAGQAVQTPVASLIEPPEDGASAAALSPQKENAKAALERARAKFEYDRQVEHETTFAAMMVDVILPVMLIAAGVVLLALELAFYHPMLITGLPMPFWARALLHGVNVITSFVFLWFGVLLVARLFGNAVGNLLTTLLKITALAVFCVAMDAIVYWGLDVITEGFAQLGGYIRLIARAVIFFPLAGLLLGLDILELVVLFLFSRLVPVMVIMFLAMIVYSLFE